MPSEVSWPIIRPSERSRSTGEYYRIFRAPACLKSTTVYDFAQREAFSGRSSLLGKSYAALYKFACSWSRAKAAELARPSCPSPQVEVGLAAVRQPVTARAFRRAVSGRRAGPGRERIITNVNRHETVASTGLDNSDDGSEG